MNKIEVRYIGPRDQWRDHLYGSGLHFTKDQVRAVPYLLGRRLLRHTDLFVVHEPGDAATSANTDSTVDQHADLLSAGQPAAQDNGQGDATGAEGEASDDTDELLDEAERERAQREKEVLDLDALHREVDQMDFQTLATFAERYGFKLTKQKGLERGRAEVHARIDQFGAV